MDFDSGNGCWIGAMLINSRSDKVEQTPQPSGFAPSLLRRCLGTRPRAITYVKVGVNGYLRNFSRRGFNHADTVTKRRRIGRRRHH
jgi:hypothetical protein